MRIGYILLLKFAIYLHMQNRLLFITSAILMVVLGTSDALRGIFSPLFLNSFGFSESEVGLIVSASYLGNLVFLLLGGVIIDRVGIKKSMITFSILMMLSLLLLLFGYVYAILVAGFFLTLGLSTLLNTTINIASDSFSSRGSLVYLNVLVECNSHSPCSCADSCPDNAFKNKGERQGRCPYNNGGERKNGLYGAAFPRTHALILYDSRAWGDELHHKLWS